MRKILFTILPYGVLCLLTIIIIILFWPMEQGGLVELTNSWIGLFFVCAFCAIFLFQDDIYHFLEQNIKSNFLLSSTPLQKDQIIPEIFIDDEKFQEIISGTLMGWIDKLNVEKEEKRLKVEEIAQTVERYKKEKKENIKWLFLFADCFLVPHSKNFLYEIYERHYISGNVLTEIAKDMSLDGIETEAILEALTFLKFIRKQEEEFIITETGSAYCSYLERINQK